MAQCCFVLARTTNGEKKQQGLSIFLVPDGRTRRRGPPDLAMLGPHHLNEVFFDDVWVTEADLLGPLDQGWSIVRRCSPSSGWASPATPATSACCSGRRWRSATSGTRCPTRSGPLGRMLIHARRARLMAYRIVDMQQKGAVRPGDAASYRIAVDPARPGELRRADRHRRSRPTHPDERLRFKKEVEEHWRYSLSATVASGSTEVQRILAARMLLGGA